MGRAPCCDKVGLKKGPWTLEEDQKLTAYIKEHGHGSWRALPKKAGLLRCGKSCRLRWTNYLRPDIKRGEFSSSEEQTIIQLHALLGNRWSAIATHLPKRTDNEIKNYWNTHLKKRLIKMGLDPVTHKPQEPTTNLTSSNNSNQLEPVNTTNGGGSSSITHMAQWESVRLEAEARLAKEATLRARGMWPSNSSSTHPSPPAQAAGSLHQQSSEFALKSPFMSLMQSCGGLMVMSTRQEMGSCNAASILDCMQLKTGAASLPLLFPRSPNLSMPALKQETGSSYWAMHSTELMNSLNNWENSLQGQAGMMWPDSWKLVKSSSINSGEGQESSSCSSPSHGTVDNASPTSTLSSLDQLSKQKSSCNVNTPFSQQARKLCWSDNNFLNVSSPLPSLDHQPLIRPPPLNQLYDGLEAGVESKGDCGEGTLLGVACLQDMMQCDGLNDGSEGSLLIGSNSSDFLGNLELVSEDISSTRRSASVDVSGGGGDIRQISYSALLGEDYTESEWNSVLKEDGDEAPVVHDNTEPKEELPL